MASLETATERPRRRALLAALSCVAVLVSAGGAGADLLDNLDLSVHGYQTWTWRNNSVSGGQASGTAFGLDNYGYDSSFDNNTSLTIDGEIINRVRLHGNINKSRFMPTDRRYYLMYDGDRTDVTLGDLNASLSGNEFATFSRTMRGLEIDTTLGKNTGFSLLTSKTDAAVKQDVLAGNNTVGPYYLTRNPIVDGSEQVWVDEQLKQRGVDYIIDYDFGVLTFQGVNVIPSTSTIAISYEYDAPGRTAGTLIGMRGTIPLSPKLTLGTSLLMQRASGGSGGGTQTGTVSHREEFFGANSVGPYSLIYRPLVEGSEVVTVGTAVQVRNTDYQLNYVSGLLTFARPVSTAALIVVDYRYESALTPPSPDQQILGIDGAWKFRENAGLNFEMAYASGGRKAGDTNPENGLAFNLRGAGQFGKLDAAVGLRKVSDGFRRLESTGFQRNESGMDLTLNYKASEHVNVQSRFNNYTSDGALNFGVTGAFNQGLTNSTSLSGKNKTSQLFGTVTLAYPEWPELRLSFQRMSNNAATSTNSSSMTSADLVYRRGKLSTQGQVSLSDQSYSSGGAALSGYTNMLGANGNQTRSGRLSFAYEASEKLRGGIDLAATAVLSGSKTTSISDTLNLGLSWSPTSKLMVSLNHYLSDSEGGYSGGSSYGGGFYSSYGGFGSSSGGGYGGYGSSYGGYGGSSFGGSSLGGYGSVSPSSYGSYSSYGNSMGSSYGGYGGGGYSSGGYSGGYTSYPSYGTGSYSQGGGYGQSGLWGSGTSGSYSPGFTNPTGVNYGGVGVDSSFGPGSASLFDGLGATSSGGIFGTSRSSLTPRTNTRQGLRSSAAEVKTDLGESSKAPNIATTVTMRGRVETDEDQPHPLQGARVVLGGKVTTTDENGRYEFVDQQVAPLTATTVALTVSKDQYGTVLDDEVEFALGQETELDSVRLPPRPDTGSVAGQVVRSVDSGFVVNAKVTIGEGEGAQSARTGDDGKFELSGVPAGQQSYTVSQSGATTATGVIDGVVSGKTVSLPDNVKLVPASSGGKGAENTGATKAASSSGRHPLIALRSRLAPVPPLPIVYPGRQLSLTTQPQKSRSVYTTLTGQYAFSDRLSMNTNFSHQVSDGTGYVSNSTSNDLSMGLSYRASDKLFLLGQWTGQTLTFLDVGGDTTSNILWLGLQWGGVSGLSATLDYQNMSTSSPGTFGGTGLTGGLGAETDPLTGSTNLGTSTITLGLRYPVMDRMHAFGEYQLVGSSGNDLYASDRKSLRFGLEYGLNRVMSLTAELQKIDSSSGHDSNNDYSATIMSSQLSLRF